MATFQIDEPVCSGEKYTAAKGATSTYIIWTLPAWVCVCVMEEQTFHNVLIVSFAGILFSELAKILIGKQVNFGLFVATNWRTLFDAHDPIRCNPFPCDAMRCEWCKWRKMFERRLCSSGEPYKVQTMSWRSRFQCFGRRRRDLIIHLSVSLPFNCAQEKEPISQQEVYCALSWMRIRIRIGVWVWVRVWVRGEMQRSTLLAAFYSRWAANKPEKSHCGSLAIWTGSFELNASFLN